MNEQTENTQPDAEITVLYDFMKLLLQAHVTREEAAKLAFPLALKLAEHVQIPQHATPHEVDLYLKAAVLLRNVVRLMDEG